MTADRLTAGETADRLVDDRLKDRGRQILFCRALIDEGLDVRLGKDTAARGDRVDCLVVFRIFIESGRIGLDQRRHLVDERSGSTGTDTVHALLDVAAFEINDLRILTAQLNRHIGLRCVVGQCGRHTDNLLHKRNVQMLCERQTAGTGDHRCDCHIALRGARIGQKIGQCLPDICKMTLVICKK